MTQCVCNPTASADPAIEVLRRQFWEYIGGELSERDFKAAVAEYSAALRVERVARIVGEHAVRSRA